MTSLVQVRADLKTAMLAKDTPKVTTLRLLINGATNLAKNSKPPRDPTDDDFVSYVTKFSKECSDTIQLTEGSGRDITSVNEQLNLARSYLPPQLEDSEIITIISNLALEGKTSIGDIMKTFNSLYRGRFDPVKLKSLIPA